MQSVMKMHVCPHFYAYIYILICKKKKKKNDKRQLTVSLTTNILLIDGQEASCFGQHSQLAVLPVMTEIKEYMQCNRLAAFALVFLLV